MRRTGIDLSPARCAVVDASVTSRWRKHGERSLLRVHNFATLEKPESAQALTAELKLLAEGGAFPRHAWVTLWDIRSSHQYIRVAPARVKDAESIAAQHGASVLDLPPRDISVGVAEGAPPADPRDKAELSFFAAASEDIHAKLRAVRAAGFIVDGVCTPCGALWAQARLRRALPGAVHAYVAIGAVSSALAIVANGFLLYGREMHWGFAAPSTRGPVVDAAALSERLASELKRSFLYLKQFWEEDVSQVLLCGAMPEIRSLTAPLIERLDIEVETLDSLDGIDTTALPDRAEEFADNIAGLRLALAIAAEPPPVNLWREDIGAERGGGRGRMILAACVMVAAALGGFFYARRNALEDHPPSAGAPLQPQAATSETRDQAVKAEPIGRATVGVERAAAEEPVRRVTPAGSDPAEIVVDSSAPPRKGREHLARLPAPAEPDPVVHAILFSSQQRSALVDNRVVRAGDLVGTDTVQSIEVDAVILVNDAGHVRRLALDRPPSPVTKK
jgi:hypothetical protein